MCMTAFVCVFHVYSLVSSKVRRGHQCSPGTELQMIVSCLVGLGIKPGSSVRASALDCCANYPSSCYFLVLSISCGFYLFFKLISKEAIRPILCRQ